MLATLTVLLPIFGLIAAGYGARRVSLLDGNAASVLNAFVVWLALPALLFDITAHSSWSALWQPGFVGAFGLATALVFAAVFLVRLRAGRPMADASVEAVAASYSNTGYVGLPLCLLVLGMVRVEALGLWTPRRIASAFDDDRLERIDVKGPLSTSTFA